jgi:lipopolysaccharide export system protein LptA
MRARFLAIIMAAALLPLPALAQKPAAGGTPNAMQGFSRNKGQPVKIDAATLEVRDKEKTATFSGDVRVNQGDTTMKCKTLVVFYEGGKMPGENPATDAKPDAKPARPSTTVGPSGDQKIKKLEARGDVVVTQNDQVATGDSAMFDMATNMVTMSGNVVLSQGQNVLRGQRLVVDMTTGFSRIESGSGGNGRVQGLFVPSGEKPSLPGPSKPPKPGSN